MTRTTRYSIRLKLGLVVLAALLPVAWFAAGLFSNGFFASAAVIINFVAWGFFAVQIFRRRKVMQQLAETAQGIGVPVLGGSEAQLLERVLFEMRRKNSSLIFNSLESRIATKDELSRTLERIVALAYRLFHAESCELALFDSKSGVYHSSFVLGKPFRSSAQAMLAGAVESGATGESSAADVIVEPISFAGTELGTLRVGLRSGTRPSAADREISKLLALQTSLALINSRYNEELLRMKRTAEDSLRAKTGFLANLSHEVRAPLGIMLNAVELVLDGLCGEINSDQRETLKMVHGNGEHLLELMNDVLDYAKVEAGKLQPQPADIDVNDLLRDVCEVVRSQAEAKKHRLAFRSAGRPLVISCDRRHARQMLINLLTNSIKYTPDGGVITVWAEQLDQTIRINVRDSGVGIDPEQRDKVFAVFERVENRYSMAQVGTGLGMPLTRRLAEVNGGVIDFSSEPGVGSHFWLAFPSVAGAAAETLDSAAAAEVCGNGETVLIVEHDQGERDMTIRYLSHHGFRMLAAANAAEARRLLPTARVALAILDNPAAEEEGGILSQLRSDPRTAEIPVVMATSRGFVFDIEKYLRAGVDRCLVKPVKLAELGRICHELLVDASAGKTAEQRRARAGSVAGLEDTWS